jgi:endonuclease/exonuclease/phosphatase (EEP) superfamily protein YafD
MTVLLLLCSAALLLASLTPYMPARPWLAIDLPSHFVIQYAIGAVLLLPLAAVLQSPLAAALLLASLALSLAQLKPYFKKPLRQGKGASLKILQANVLMTNRNTEALRNLILEEKPDVVTCAEVSPAFAMMLEGLKPHYPHQVVTPGQGGYRVAVISARPFLRITQADFCGARTQSLIFSLDVGGTPVEAVSLHPFTPIANITNRDSEFEAIAAYFSSNTPAHLLLMGDLNATPWCPALKKLKRALNLSNAREGRGLGASWPSWTPFSFLRLPIDHVLAGPNLFVSEFRVGPSVGSDHLPTLTRISVSNG